MLELRTFIDEMGTRDARFEITDNTWKEIEVLERVLLEPYKVTMIVQDENCSLGDFYGAWLQAKRNLQKFDHEMAHLLLNKMINRETGILRNKLMLSAVFLDPRYKFLLTEEEKSIAICHLCQLYLRIQGMKPHQEDVLEQMNEDGDDFAEYLSNSAHEFIPNESRNTILTEPHVLYKLKNFQMRPSIHYKTKINEYWNGIKAEEPELNELAVAILCVPVAQVSVERGFSSLTYIFNNYRSCLAPQVLNEVLLLRLNYELAPKPHEYVSQYDFQDGGGINFSYLIESDNDVEV